MAKIQCLGNDETKSTRVSLAERITYTRDDLKDILPDVPIRMYLNPALVFRVIDSETGEIFFSAYARTFARGVEMLSEYLKGVK